MLERLQKFISSAGVASRRHAEQLILDGKVKVNGKVVKEMGVKIDPTKDKVEVGGKKISELKKIYIILNKPAQYVTTRHDPQHRKTVFDLLPQELRTQVWPVGRLDFTTEGLLILTNDGELTQTLTHPSREHEKEYFVELDREISEGKLNKIKTGVKLDGRMTSPAYVSMVDDKKLYMTIHEGWNRQIKRMFSALGYTVRHLKRVRIGKLKLGSLPLGEFDRVTKDKLI